MRVYKALERKSYVLGIPMMECGVLVCLLLSLMILGAIAGIFIPLSGWFYLISLALILILYIILRRAAKQNHPSFLLSWVSYHFFQPFKILMR